MILTFKNDFNYNTLLVYFLPFPLIFCVAQLCGIVCAICVNGKIMPLNSPGLVCGIDFVVVG